MTKRNPFLLTYCLYASLLFLTPLHASPPSQTNDEGLSTLLSPHEQALVEKEATQGGQEEASQEASEEHTAQSEEINSPEADNKEALKIYKNNSSYSRSGRSVNRYNLERRTPGSAFKSTPSQRSFGN